MPSCPGATKTQGENGTTFLFVSFSSCFSSPSFFIFYKRVELLFWSTDMTSELATCKINEKNNNLFTFSTISPGPSWVSLMPRVGYVVVGDPKNILMFT